MVLLIASVAPAVAGPRDACAARAEKAATGQAVAEDRSATMSKFTEVKPSKTEAGAGDKFFDATFSRSGSHEVLKFHVIMWCAGTKSPLAMAIQRRYD